MGGTSEILKRSQDFGGCWKRFEKLNEVEGESCLMEKGIGGKPRLPASRG
jgi:hypothetical protein